MSILLLGSNGMLGQAIAKELDNQNLNYCSLDKNNAEFCCDITNDKTLIALIHKLQPKVIINTVAIIDLKLCESNPGQAYLVNSRPLSILANLSKQVGFKLVQISTDHFFTNDVNKIHAEEDSVVLVNEYAKTKYLAEVFARMVSNSLIIRTNIVGFKCDINNPTFVEWAINKIKSEETIVAFDDYYTSSIDTSSFAKLLIELIKKNIDGVINLASSEVFSKQQFISLLAQKIGRSNVCIIKESIHSLSGIKRAESLGLDVTCAESILGVKCPTLNTVLENLVKEYNEI